MKTKTLNDFLWWLEVCGLLHLYFAHAQSNCGKYCMILSDHIKYMDANKPETLFRVLKDCDFWDEPKEKYINLLKEN